ncbi:MAG TPA: hypothetical protein VFK46_06160 [Candidatus Macondimonas sp.]|jgi:hypothetical protein|nr:hypothetical protein [Candidatus Macondimonas sp.]
MRINHNPVLPSVPSRITQVQLWSSPHVFSLEDPLALPNECSKTVQKKSLINKVYLLDLLRRQNGA